MQTRGAGRVLVVEEDDGVRRLLRLILTLKELAVVDATSAVEAERRLDRDRAPDAIIIDLALAETRGLDLLRRLRRRPELDLVPMILITASPSEAAQADALEAGADAVVLKPFGVAHLQERVMRLLNEGRPRLLRVIEPRARRRLAG
jgi:two-component system alkaline phosphatase synthesis response regulator PhoP